MIFQSDIFIKLLNIYFHIPIYQLPVKLTLLTDISCSNRDTIWSSWVASFWLRWANCLCSSCWSLRSSCSSCRLFQKTKDFWVPEITLPTNNWSVTISYRNSLRSCWFSISAWLVSFVVVTCISIPSTMNLRVLRRVLRCSLALCN